MTRIWLGVALAAALLGGGWLAYNRAYNAGLEAGQSAVRAEWAEANSKAMAKGGVTSLAMKKYGRNLARAMNQKKSSFTYKKSK